MAAHAHRQSAGAGLRGAVDVGGLLPDLHKYREVRVVDIHRHVGERLRQIAAHRLADLNGVEAEGLVRPAALHLEAAGGGKGVPQVGLGGLHDGLHRFLAGHRPGHGGDAEHLLAGVPGALQVARVSLGLHVDGALADIDLKAAVVAQTAADVAHQLVLKGPAVEALQDHLAKLEQENLLLVHKSSSEYAKSRKYLRMILHSILHLSSKKKP